MWFKELKYNHQYYGIFYSLMIYGTTNSVPFGYELTFDMTKGHKHKFWSKLHCI